jgi:uncharacterized protein
MSMELDNSFTVPVPPDQAWDVLLDVERIAPCMPGATVDEVDGDVINGRIKVKVGPVSLTYRGTAKFTERDDDSRTVVLEASGKETRGSGTASATVRASLQPDSAGNGTLVAMHTTMNVTGRPAQFGRGVMADVSGKLVDQFAQNLSQLIGGDGAASGAGTGDGGAGTAAGGEAAGGSGADVAAGGVNTAAGGKAAGGGGADVAAGSTGAGVDAAAAARADGVQRTGSGGASAATGNGAVTTVPVTHTTAEAFPKPNQDSLNLVRLVGPALLKRVLPAAAIAAGVALLGRRLFRRSRHRAAS